MSHQPFETWILDPGTLSKADRYALKAHLATCPQCQRLERRWAAVHQQLRAKPVAAPAPGFTQRWQAGLAERRAREQRRQAWKIFGILMGCALFILLLLAGYTFATTTPAKWLIGLIQMIASLKESYDVIAFAAQTWLSTTPFALNVALWIYLTVMLCVLSLAWTLILWRTKTAGVQSS